VYVLCSPVNLLLSQNNNINLRGLRKSARRRACALERASRCFRHKDIDHILKSEHEYTLLRLPRTIAVHGYLYLALDIDDVNFKALDLSSMHYRFIGFSFNIMLLDILKPNTPKRSTPHANVIPSSDGAHPDGDRKKAAVSVTKYSQRSAFELKPGEKYSDFTSHCAHFP
jgi:hypothetical protein